ncbi:N-acetyl-gamma-glutamyl-phosphate reductase [Candidatus Mesenet endosymbiont of Agriotes lineatus]|uniref:N-acetyl-gamma-glutamyl-phosphate reductase n=1 Tax=Candidatus Mesenet endosymbiont of Agriotes lineatus TaxID=3077948 RepID=UPI0030D3925D
MECKRVAVIGATGYTGIEVVRLLLNHPSVTIEYLSANQNTGLLSKIYPHILNDDLFVISIDEVYFDNLDAVFLCLPHGQSNRLISKIPKKVKVIDLSADFRIKNLSLYEEWYGAHKSPDLVKDAVYGLSEIYRENIKTACLVACPGCYATSVLLPLLPLLKLGIVKEESIIIDAKSGVSGAGRSLSNENLFCEVNGSVKAYKISNHRHIPEIEQEAGLILQKDVRVQFTPHLIPISRGILCSIYLNLKESYSLDYINSKLKSFYKDASFILINANKSMNIRSVVGTNQCQIGVFLGRIENSIVVVSSIDNLLKGAAGQALQNFNIMFGFDEMTGLSNIPFYP